MIRDETKERITNQLESLEFGEAQKKILHAELGYDLGSPNHFFCLSWLESKEAERRDERDIKVIRMASDANSIASNAESAARRANLIAIISMLLNVILIISYFYQLFK